MKTHFIGRTLLALLFLLSAVDKIRNPNPNKKLFLTKYKNLVEFVRQIFEVNLPTLASTEQFKQTEDSLFSFVIASEVFVSIGVLFNSMIVGHYGAVLQTLFSMLLYNPMLVEQENFFKNYDE